MRNASKGAMENASERAAKERCEDGPRDRTSKAREKHHQGQEHVGHRHRVHRYKSTDTGSERAASYSALPRVRRLVFTDTTLLIPAEAQYFFTHHRRDTSRAAQPSGEPQHKLHRYNSTDTGSERTIPAANYSRSL